MERDIATALLHTLFARCDSCFGLCCVALCFSRADGFPGDKLAEKPCGHLSEDYRCQVHNILPKKFPGCAAYDCLGAGQRTYALYGGKSWRKTGREQFEVFLTLYRLHQIIWYTAQAACLEPARPLRRDLEALLTELGEAAKTVESILAADATAFRGKANPLLREAAELVRESMGVRSGKSGARPGKRFQGDQRGKDFSMALLMAADFSGCSLPGANFIGADLRDANLAHADLSRSIFLTQSQINGAKGNGNTKLPLELKLPSHWMGGAK